MKKLLLPLAIVIAGTVGVRASVIFSDTFTYANGNLVGDDGWLQNGTSAATPIQVTAGRAVLGTSGQERQCRSKPLHPH